MGVTVRYRRIFSGLLIGLGVCLVTGVLASFGVLQRLEWITYDYRMQHHRAQAPLHPDLAVIVIDEPSLALMNPIVGRYPWPRTVFADLVDFLADGGAEAVVFDILFTERESGRPTTGMSAGEERLVQSSQSSGKVFHALHFLELTPDEMETKSPNQPLPEEFQRRFAFASGTGFVANKVKNGFAIPETAIFQSARRMGAVGLEVDRDGIIRRVPLLFDYQGSVFPSIALAPLMDRLGAQAKVGPGAIGFGDLHVPTDEKGHILVNMSGVAKPYSIGGIFSSIQNIKRGDVENLRVYPDEFAGKIVFVGASAIGLEDNKTTSLAQSVPGVLIHASIASTFLERAFLTPAPRSVVIAISVTLVFATILSIFATSRIFLQLSVPVAFSLCYGALAFWLFGKGYVLDMAAPLVAVALSLVSTYGFLMFTEGREKRRIRAMFGQYVSPAILAELVDTRRDQLRAEVGARERLSILFSDLRGFTSLSENLAAEQVVELLNIHFSAMSEIIFRHQGTLDKFIGDAVMAFWGAPIRLPDHAQHAVRAALKMARAMKEVNETLATRGFPPIDTGLGVNTGEVVLGNIGSEHKLNYTVIGDHVNLSSRLEGLTKQYGCQIIISEYTYMEFIGRII